MIRRHKNTQLIRKLILVLTEGEKTEPIYFDFKIRSIPRNTVTIKITGTGYNTLKLVQHALGFKRDYDEIWVVFDEDDTGQKFDDAISLAIANDIKLAVSNEAFELWYLLHFQYLDTAIKRDIYIEILNRIISQKIQKPQAISIYSKNDLHFVIFLSEYGDESKAIAYAERLFAAQQVDFALGGNSQRTPFTTVHHLVKKINSLC